jgi:F0F1-type ATP synthase membrane subunit c/vacuolar-type H+-ATPase subunit K
MIELILIGLLVFLAFYFSIGFGFSLAAWLQAAEISVNQCEDIPSFFPNNLVIAALWPAIALYCYKTEVTKTVNKLDWDKIPKK